MIAIIDYGMGNLRSVGNALEAVGAQVTIATESTQLKDASGIILPGVGAFGDGMRNLCQRGFKEALAEQVLEHKKPFLGLCLGLQLLGTTGYEHGEHEGLGWIPGTVEKLPVSAPLRIPHIGWNDVRIAKESVLYQGLGESAAFYFVHSFALKPTDSTVVNGICNYGSDFVASVQRANIYATQFHPEKSHKAGLTILRNWVKLTQGEC